MKYKGYSGTIELDQDEGVFHGRVIGITDVVNYEGHSAGDLTKAFRDSVDDYIAFCKERGEEPEKPFSGKFIVRISPELHCLVVEAARSSGQSLNAWVKSAMEAALKSSAMPELESQSRRFRKEPAGRKRAKTISRKT